MGLPSSNFLVMALAQSWFAERSMGLILEVPRVGTGCFPARMNWTRLFSAACLHMVPLPWLLWKRRWIRPLWIEQILGMGEPGFFVPRPVLHV